MPKLFIRYGNPDVRPTREFLVRFGVLRMPSQRPERSMRDGQVCDLQELERLDDLGFEEAWIGEHFTTAWEACSAPDLSEKSSQETRRKRGAASRRLVGAK